MTFWFFGDSWPAGVELAGFRDPPGHRGDSEPDLAYPAIIGRHLGIDIDNRAEAGTSIPTMIEQIKGASVRPGDITIFACSAKTRRFYRSSAGEPTEVQYTPDITLSNAFEDDRVCSQALVLLYFLSREQGARPCFFNLFDTFTQTDDILKYIPTQSWIIPPNTSAVGQWFDPEYFNKFRDYHYGDYRDWLESERDAVKSYIRPCLAHANPSGHNVIANRIISWLTF